MDHLGVNPSPTAHPADLRPERPAQTVRLVENTLREGVETPGVRFSIDDRVRLARQLDKLGVDYIEAGSPGLSAAERDAVRAVVQAGLDAQVTAIGRVFQPEYNDACLEAGVRIIHLSVLTSDLGIEHVLRRPRPEIIDASARMVQQLKAEGVQVFFSATDGSRAQLGFLIDLAQALESAGVDAFVFADSMGVMSPPAMARTVEALRQAMTVAIDVHCHNDFGLGVANSLAAVQAGAEIVDVSLSGLGARVGNTNLAEFVVALQVLYGGKTNVRTEYLVETAQVLAAITGQPMHPGWPIVGERAFCSIEGLGLRTYPGPIADVLKSQLLRPELVGNREWEAARV